MKTGANNDSSQDSDLFNVEEKPNPLSNGHSNNQSPPPQQDYQHKLAKYFEQLVNSQIQRRLKLVQEVYQYVQALADFHKQNFFQRKYVYLISNNWIQKWKKFTCFQLIQRGKMLPLQIESQDLSGYQINSDLIDPKLEPNLKIQNEDQYDNYLKRSIQQQRQFIYANEEVWNIFSRYKRIELKCEIIINKDTKEYVAEISPVYITMIVLSDRIIKRYKAKKIQSFPVYTVQFSKYRSFGIFILTITEIILRKVNISVLPKTDEPYNSDFDSIKFHLVDPSFSQSKVLSRIKNSILAQENANQHSFNLPLVQIDHRNDIGSQIPSSNPVFVCHIQERDQIPQTKFFYSFKKSNPYINCPVCKTKCQLAAHCGCKYISYCSQACQNSDYNHIKKCDFRQKSSKYNEENGSRKNGLVGLCNLGNTCFMNSGLQCLSNIPELTQYFISDAYEKNINRQSNLGSKGNLARSYAHLLKNLWCNAEARQFSPFQFKRSISSFQKLFAGYQQHDSGQFLTYLLDGLHEDLNLVKVKPYFEVKQIDDRPQHLIAQQQWTQFIQRNNSKIVQLMFGQYKSKVQCPTCKYKSLQFDPFMLCSLPISSKPKEVQIIFQDNQTFTDKIQTLTYRSGDRLIKIVKNLSEKIRLKQNQQLLLYHSKTVFDLNAEIETTIMRYKKIFVRIMFEKYQIKDGLRTIINFQQLSSVNGISYHSSSPVFGTRLYLFRKNLTFIQIHNMLKQQIQKILPQKLNQLSKPVELPKKLIQITNQRQQNSVCWNCRTRCRGCPFPQTNQTLQRIQHTLLLRYKVNAKVMDISKLHDPAPTGSQKYQQIHLQDCFTAFKQPEILTADNAWKCPKCKNMVPAKKQLMIYKLPKILMICLKRFKKKGYFMQKNQCFVHFPINELDLTDMVINPELPIISKQSEPRRQHKQKVLYELFAVSYHYGTSTSGHYTAACKNFQRNCWFEFDDSKVTPIKANQIINSNAYILFYRRKDSNASK